MVMVKAGLRVAECADLDINDIIIAERSGAIIVRDGKGGKMRKVPIESEILRPALRAWLDVRGNFPATALFINARGARLSTHHIREVVKEYGRKINAPAMTPHWLRYTFAKQCERRGVPIATISLMLGHDSIDTTVRYLRSSLAELQSAVEW
jgi:site-specific recombinase XerD